MRRRKFLGLTAFSSLAFIKGLNALGNLLGVDPAVLQEPMNSENFFSFHYFVNDLANFHFYFINCSHEPGWVLPSGKNSYMVVRLPQQHVADQLLDSDKFADAVKSPKPAWSKLSGYSYLAFQLFPDPAKAAKTPKKNKEKRLPLTPEALLNWNNSSYYRMVTLPPKPAMIIKESFPDFQKEGIGANPTAQDLVMISRINESNYAFYQRACQSLLSNNGEDWPVTLLEIPVGLFLGIYIKDTDHTSIVFENTGLRKKDFIFRSEHGTNVLRTVLEVWNTRAYAQTLAKPEKDKPRPTAVKNNPLLRGIGYRLDKADTQDLKECPTNHPAFLPGLLDEQEIVYLTSLYVKQYDISSGPGGQVTKVTIDGKGDEYNINSDILSFTSLGTTSQFVYKNYQPPDQTDLAVYEHHISLGRDEYVKVARLGAISVTGQRALYIMIGRRKIDQGVSYMDFEQYVEIVQPEVLYYDPELIDPRNNVNTDPNEPDNTIIYAWKERNTNKINQSHFGYREDLLADVQYNITNQQGQAAAREINYRRWPFKKVIAQTLFSPPIGLGWSAGHAPDAGTTCDPFFWPVYFADATKDVSFNFRGTDWNDKLVTFTCSFMFVRKSWLETGQTLLNNNLKNIYDEFFWDLKNPGGDAGIKARAGNRRKIYFNQQKIAYAPDYIPTDTTGKNIAPNKSNVAATDFIEYYFGIFNESGSALFPKLSEPFNLRVYPLFPQMKRSQLYNEHLQDYSPEPVAAIVEHNQGYVKFAFNKKDASGYLYNKAKLLFDFTEDFKNNLDNDLAGGNQKIQAVFNNAGQHIGGIVNPDVRVESIGLLRQGLTLGKNMNELAQRGATAAQKADQEIRAFNPADLLRGLPKLFGGIDLLQILSGSLDSINTALFHARNLTDPNQSLDTAANKIMQKIVSGNPEIQNLKIGLNNLQAAANTLQGQKDKAQSDVLAAYSSLSANKAFRSAQTMVNKYVELRRRKFMDVLDNSLPALKQYAQHEWIASLPQLRSVSDKLTEWGTRINGLPDQARNEISPKITGILNNFNATFGAALNALPAFADLQTAVNAATAASLALYETYKARLQDLTDAKSALLQQINAATTDAYNNANAAYQTAYTAYSAQSKRFTDALQDIAGSIDAHIASDLNTAQIALAKELKDVATAACQLPLVTDVYAILQDYQALQQDYKTFISKIPDENQMLTEVQHQLDQAEATINQQITDYYTALEQSYGLGQTGAKVDAYLTGVINKGKTDYSSAVSEARMNILEKVSVLKKPIDDLQKFQKDLDDDKTNLNDALNAYEDALAKQAADAAMGIVDQINAFIAEEEDRIAQGLDAAGEIIADVNEAKRLLTILNSLTKQEITYTWETSNFQPADFGLIKFIPQTSPATTLSVNVVTTINLSPGQFPSVIKNITYQETNRFTSFGIGFMDAVIINFKEISVVGGSNQSPSFHVSIGDVQFSGAFAFVQALEDAMSSLLGDAFKIDIGPTAIALRYTIPIPDIEAPAFSFFNFSIGFYFRLSFINEPMQFGFSLATAEEKFGISVGIYGGFGFFAITAEPHNGITKLETALEFGGYFGFSLGPLSGDIKLVVGLYFSKQGSDVLMEGYFLCEGNAQLWFLMINARFFMGIVSNGNYAVGTCSVSYSIRLGAFFSLSFSATYSKTIAGAVPANDSAGQNSSNNALEAYQAREAAVPPPAEKVNKAFKQRFSRANMSALTQQEKQARKKEFHALNKSDYQRSVSPMSFEEWETYIDSFVD